MDLKNFSAAHRNPVVAPEFLFLQGDGKWGNRKYDKDFTSLKSGQQFSAEVVGKGGSIIFAVYKGNVGKNGVVVNLPSMTAQWESAQ